MATKPTIAGWEWEYDSSTPVVGDGVAIGTWVDSKPGGGTNAVQSQGIVRMGAIGGVNQWSDDENGIIFDDLDGAPDTQTFNPANMLLSSITLFAVIETTDVSLGCAIIGTPDGINPETGIYLVVYPDGSIHFIIGKNGAQQHRDIGSAPGLFVDGTRAFITARLDITTSTKTLILRVNGVEVASFSGFDGGSDFWFGPRIGQANLTGIGNIAGNDRNMPYIGGYSTAASDAEVAQMESYLFDRFVRVFTIWTPFPGSSGNVGVVNGATVGVTDFSEFAVAGGLPEGITHYGIGTGDPSAVAIVNDPVEGNYFEMTGMAPFQAVLYGYGIDAFNNQGIFGELLARVWMNVNTDLNWGGGPCFRLSGLIGEPLLTDMNGAGWTVRRNDAGPNWGSQGNETFGGTVSVPVNNQTMQELPQNGAWVWVRVRVTENLAFPTRDDWEVTAWHGELSDEPAVPDGTGTVVTPASRFVGTIGWWNLFGSTAEQRIAFLSFSSDPLLEPPPTELLLTPWENIPAVSPGTSWAQTTP